jgi:hypothetical protein
MAGGKKPPAFMAVERLSGKKRPNILHIAASHNKREARATIKIDPERSHLNEALEGPPDAAGVMRRANELMTAAGVAKLRKDAIQALECVFSLPPNHGLDERAYFSDCAAWAAGHFVGAPVLSVDIHRDESAPHCHVLILPLVAGRMVGSSLFGSPQKMPERQASFHAAVAHRYGLGAPPKRRRTMAEVFTSPGKGPKDERRPIGFAPPMRDRSLSCVGFPSPQRHAHAIQPPLIDDGFRDWLDGALDRATSTAWARITARPTAHSSNCNPH